MEIFKRSTICGIYFHSIIYVNENYSCENAGMNINTVRPQVHVHAQALPVFLLQRFGTTVETRRIFHRDHAESITTTCLSRNTIA